MGAVGDLLYGDHVLLQQEPAAKVRAVHVHAHQGRGNGGGGARTTDASIYLHVVSRILDYFEGEWPLIFMWTRDVCFALRRLVAFVLFLVSSADEHERTRLARSSVSSTRGGSFLRRSI